MFNFALWMYVLVVFSRSLLQTILCLLNQFFVSVLLFFYENTFFVSLESFFFFIIILNIQNVWYNISLPFGFLVCWMQYSFWFFEYFAFAFLMAIQYFAGQLYFHKVAAKKRLDVWKYESFRVFWKWGKIGKKQ